MILIGLCSLIFAIIFVMLFYGKIIGLSALLFLIPFLYCFIYIRNMFKYQYYEPTSTKHAYWNVIFKYKQT